MRFGIGGRFIKKGGEWWSPWTQKTMGFSCGRGGSFPWGAVEANGEIIGCVGGRKNWGKTGGGAELGKKEGS